MTADKVLTVHECLVVALQYRKNNTGPASWQNTRYRNGQIEECREAIALDLVVSFRDRCSAATAKHRDLALVEHLAIYSEAVVLVKYVDELMNDEGLP